MKIIFSKSAWSDYQYWAKNDANIIKKIHLLLKDIQNHPYMGIGKPEALKYELQNFWSRRINKEHRLVYQINNEQIQVISCRFHYN
ncbi:MAG TPA: Txe/YoeB family addiction module toxin [Candidatus Gracilibacteria bacterium]|nr:Txe/YoeB family addiction module toxin [Candidatus Gracilibacteria bacterium]